MSSDGVVTVAPLLPDPDAANGETAADSVPVIDSAPARTVDSELNDADRTPGVETVPDAVVASEANAIEAVPVFPELAI